MIFKLLAFSAPLQFLKMAGLNVTLFDLCILIYFIIHLKHMFYDIKLFFASSVFFLFILLGLILSNYPVEGTKQFVQWVFIFIFLYPVINSIFKSKCEDEFFNYFIYGIFTFCICHLIDILISPDYIAGRYIGLFGDAQPTSFYSSILFSFSLSTLCFKKNNKFLNIINATILFIIILLTASRTGLLCIVITFLYVLYYFLFKYKKYMFNKFLIIFTIFITIIFTYDMFIFEIQLFDKVAERLVLTQDVNSTVTSGRIILFDNAISSINLKSLLVGYGLENYIFESSSEKKPHNVFFLYFLESGFIGILFLIFIFTCVIKNGIKNKFLIAPLFSLIIIFSFNTVIINRLFWVLLFIILRYKNEKDCLSSK